MRKREEACVVIARKVGGERAVINLYMLLSLQLISLFVC